MQPAIQNTLSFFVTVLMEIIPLFLAVTFLAGLTLEYVKPQTIRDKLGGKTGVAGILAATVLGFVTPFCSCSTIPLLAGMMAAGIPISVLTAFLFASPYPVEVGLIVLGPMFGWSFALAFVATGAIIAAASGLILQRLDWQSEIKDEFIEGLARQRQGGGELACGCCENGEVPGSAGCGCEETERLASVEADASTCGCGVDEFQPPCCCNEGNQNEGESACACGAGSEPAISSPGQPQTTPKDGFQQKARRAALYSLDFFKRMFHFIVVGCVMGALIYGFVPEDLLAAYMGGTSLLAVPMAALIGAPLYVSIIPIIPIVLSLSTKGVSTGAIIAFMITATAISPPELIMLSGMFKKRYILLFITMMIVGAIATGYIFNIMSL